MIYSLARAVPEDREWMTQLLTEKRFDPVRFAQLKEKLESLEGIAYTRGKAQKSVDRSEQALALFDASASKTILTLIANYAVHRKV